jgi:hypothetical protein
MYSTDTAPAGKVYEAGWARHFRLEENLFILPIL